jgi:uncharacterized membrane protein (UPF0182 family)
MPMLLHIMRFLHLHLLLLHLIQTLILWESVKLTLSQKLKQMQMLMLNCPMLLLLMLDILHLLPTISTHLSAKPTQRGNVRKFLSRLHVKWLSHTASLSQCACLSHAHTAPL